jgi:hypothetical protein
MTTAKATTAIVTRPFSAQTVPACRTGSAERPFCGVIESGTYPASVADEDAVTVTLTLDQWGMVLEALDEYEYAVEHSPGGGIRPSTRQRYRDRRERLMQAIPDLARTVRDATGLPEL